MSQSANIVYELARERRRELYLNRIKENTKYYLVQYSEMYEEFRRRCFFDLIPDEMKQLKVDLNSIRELVDVDIEKANQISKDVGDYIYSFKSMAHEVENQEKEISIKRLARQQIENQQKTNEMYKQLDKLLSSIPDPIVRDFAFDLSWDLKEKLKKSQGFNFEKIQNEFESIFNEAKKKAEKWKNNKKQINRKHSVKEKIETQIERIEKSKKENSKEIEKILKNLKQAQQNIDNTNITNIEEVISENSKKAEEVVLDERIRRETVRSLYNILNQQGFIVSKPRIDINENLVILSAKKPSGNKANCKIKLDGKFSYEFDGYKGMSCNKDIEDMKKQLNEIYGIKLKDEQITWENPKRIYKDADSMPSSNTNENGG
jgi:Sec-independent protein translocase protein TatA/copper chaperone CopZ